MFLQRSGYLLRQAYIVWFSYLLYKYDIVYKPMPPRSVPVLSVSTSIPDCDTMPAHWCKDTQFFLTSELVAFYLIPPKFHISLGRNIILHPSCPCQKQPFMKMTVRYFRSTRSGCPGSREWFSLYRNSRLNKNFLTSNSGFVFSPFIADIQCASVLSWVYPYLSDVIRFFQRNLRNHRLLFSIFHSSGLLLWQWISYLSFSWDI